MLGRTKIRPVLQKLCIICISWPMCLFCFVFLSKMIHIRGSYFHVLTFTALLLAVSQRVFLCIYLTLHCIFLAHIYSRILAFWLMLSVVKTTLNKFYLILSYPLWWFIFHSFVKCLCAIFMVYQRQPPTEFILPCAKCWDAGCTHVVSFSKREWPNWSLLWRHNGRDCVSNHQPHECLLNRLFRRRSKKTSKLRVTGLCAGNSPGTVNSPRKWPVNRKMFPFDDVIMYGVPVMDR